MPPERLAEMQADLQILMQYLTPEQVKKLRHAVQKNPAIISKALMFI